MGRIVCLSDNVSTDYVRRIADGAQAALRGSPHSFQSVNLHGSNSTLTSVLEQGVLAGVILTAPLSDDRAVLTELERQRVPFIRIAAMLDLERGGSVNMDEFLAARSIVAALLDAGHRRIAFIRGSREHLVSIRRFNGYAGALGAVGVSVDHDLIEQGDFSRESGRRAAEALFPKHPTAIFASNDDMAFGVLDAARKAGMSIPGQISLVGFDDHRDASRSQPPLTTVRQLLGEMGRQAAEMLLEAIGGALRPGTIRTVPFELMQRSSIAPIQRTVAA